MAKGELRLPSVHQDAGRLYAHSKGADTRRDLEDDYKQDHQVPNPAQGQTEGLGHGREAGDPDGPR